MHGPTCAPRRDDVNLVIQMNVETILAERTNLRPTTIAQREESTRLPPTVRAMHLPVEIEQSLLHRVGHNSQDGVRVNAQPGGNVARIDLVQFAVVGLAQVEGQPVQNFTGHAVTRQPFHRPACIRSLFTGL